MPRIPRTFRLHAKNIFLTYPHCSLSKQDALDQILCIECPSNKKFIRVTRELHENGEPHIHMLIQFEGKIQLYNTRHFDLRHVSNSSTFHPNIKGAKSSSDVKSYIGKDGDYIDWGHFQIDGRSASGGALAANDAYASALNTAMANEGEMKGDKLVLRGLKFHGYHGVKEEENKLGQKFVIDVDAWMNLGPAGISDSLSDTISYTDIYRIVKGVVEGTPRKLLETVAQLIASETLAKHPRISAVRVQVQKPHVSVPGSIDFLGVEITRYRSTDSPK